MSDIADDGDCCGGIVPRGGGDMGPNTGSEVVFGVTFQGVVAFAERHYISMWNGFKTEFKLIS